MIRVVQRIASGDGWGSDCDEDAWLAAVAEARGKPDELRAALWQLKGWPTVSAVPALRSVLRVNDRALQREVINLLL
jgi:hypothetical protein